MIEAPSFPKGSRVEGVDLEGVHLHGAVLDDAKLTDASLCGADISGDITGLRINGVEVESYVQAELDRRFPQRVQLRSTHVEGLRDAWSMLEGLWAATTERALSLPPGLQSRRVAGEWSFVETIRHLILATDCWYFRAIQLAPRPYHPWGLAWDGIETDRAQAMGLDGSADPDLAELLPVRLGRQRAVRDFLQHVTDAQLAEVRSAPDTPGHPTGEHSLLQCLAVLLNEEWEHHRYAVRDLDALESTS